MAKKSPSTVEELRLALKEIGLSTYGNKDTLRKRWKERNARLEQVRRQQALQTKTSADKGMKLRYLLVVDVEATCEEGCGFSYMNEIIEFPCLLYDLEQKRIIDEFHTYVKPRRIPTLSNYCKELTKIPQKLIDNAPPFKTVLDLLHEFLSKHDDKLIPPVNGPNTFEWSRLPKTAYHFRSQKNWAWACDGPWDMASFVAKEFATTEENNPPSWINGPFVDVRSLFSDAFRVSKSNINAMLSRWNLTFEGQEHNGLDDARNLVRVIQHMQQEDIEFEHNRWWLQYQNVGWCFPRKYAPFIPYRPKGKTIPHD
ncbi:double-strand siRNA ribonuclease [Schizosaccharomyces japonicus yFS275]|uniref:Double-strand siRNA ribonuclease n=1 Tax=Schizosaccharomyces japonicus (strain yFS275 / FY16936) TaxID=402676 RepID=B6K6N2_SCHJY|nr:double-strand siRNA ribonuclease [Schizosaccharomyces japonicus yFS275]EEB09186.1 double-strand siRNA ribonuclease [Schizosaccharomyces japonicus yFS275]